MEEQIAECEIIRDLATDPEKRDLFGRLANKVLAAEVKKRLRQSLLGRSDPVISTSKQRALPFPLILLDEL